MCRKLTQTLTIKLIGNNLLPEAEPELSHASKMFFMLKQ